MPIEQVPNTFLLHGIVTRLLYSCLGERILTVISL